MSSKDLKMDEYLLRQRRTPPPITDQTCKKRATVPETVQAKFLNPFQRNTTGRTPAKLQFLNFTVWMSKIASKRKLGLCFGCLLIWSFTARTGFEVLSSVLAHGKGKVTLVKDSNKVSRSSYDPQLDDILQFSASSEVESFADMKISGKIIAVGDLHGDLRNARIVLRMAGVMNETDDWIFGSKTLVQTGDILDRGKHSIEILRLFIKLRWQARKAGGRVINILGNHEVMNLLTDYRYVNAEEFGRWGGWNGWNKLFDHGSELGKFLRS